MDIGVIQTAICHAARLLIAGLSEHVQFHAYGVYALGI